MIDLTSRNILNATWDGSTVRDLNGVSSHGKIKFVDA